jgi:hypothetical protein
VASAAAHADVLATAPPSLPGPTPPRTPTAWMTRQRCDDAPSAPARMPASGGGHRRGASDYFLGRPSVGPPAAAAAFTLHPA